MAQIETRTSQDGKTSYRVRVRIKGRPAESATFTRLTDARKWGQQTEAAIREGRYFKTSAARRHTIAEAIERYLREIMPHKPRSAGQQTPQLHWWKDRIGAYTLADATPALIVEHRATLIEEKSGPTANRYVAALSHVFSKCVEEWGWLDDSPMRKVRPMAESRGRVRFLDEDVKVDGKGERTRLLEACRSSADGNLYDAVVVALSTGARKNEVLHLRWKDVDLERGRMILHETKNGERRTVPLAGHALERLRERSRIRRIDCDLVFPAATKPVAADVDRAFAKAREMAKIGDFRFHDLRHSTASYLAMNGATLAEIAEVLGHKTLAMVRRYAHLTEGHTSRVVERMNAAVFDCTKLDSTVCGGD